MTSLKGFPERGKNNFTLILVLLILTLQIFTCLQAQNPTEIVFSDEDRKICKEKLTRYSSQDELPSGELLRIIGESFIGTPYVAKTLEVEPEQLVVNLHGFDCTTFVESCMALMRCVKDKDTSCAGFSDELMQLRYRNNVPEGYSSRLHYFSEWIIINSLKGYVKDITAELGAESFDVELDFMSSHPALYLQLSKDSNLVREISKIERKISAFPFFYIPKEKLKEAEQGICNGDILATTSTVRGLDIAHTGFAVWKDGRIFMLHASSLHKKVEVTEQPLQEYLLGIKNMSGVMVIRPLQQK